MNPFRSFRFLDGLRLKDLARLIKCATPANFAPGERLFNEGDPANDLFLIKTGSVALRSQEFLPNDMLKVVGAGDVIGCPCFAGLEWPATGYALEQTSVIILHGPRVTVAAAQDPLFGLELTRRLIELKPYVSPRSRPVRAEEQTTGMTRVFETRNLSECPTEGVVSL